MEDVICHVTHAGSCNPHKCSRKVVPVIHGVYLFPHWERSAMKENTSHAHCKFAMKVEKKSLDKLMNAIHKLRQQQQAMQVVQPYVQPVDQRKSPKLESNFSK